MQAEVFVLRMHAGAVELAGPCGPDPWYVEVGSDEDPVDEWKAVLDGYVPEPFRHLG